MPRTLSIVVPAFALALTCSLAAGCGDDEDCGPAGAAAELAITAGETTITYGSFVSSPNNDCPPPGGGGPTSITIEGRQVGPTDSGFPLTLCLPRPDALGSEPHTVELDDGELIQLISLSAQVDDCTISLDRSSPPVATGTFTGLCDDGTHAAGYALTLGGTASGTSSCPGGDTPVQLTFAGTVAVSAATE